MGSLPVRMTILKMVWAMVATHFSTGTSAATLKFHYPKARQHLRFQNRALRFSRSLSSGWGQASGDEKRSILPMPGVDIHLGHLLLSSPITFRRNGSTKDRR